MYRHHTLCSPNGAPKCIWWWAKFGIILVSHSQLERCHQSTTTITNICKMLCENLSGRHFGAQTLSLSSMLHGSLRRCFLWLRNFHHDDDIVARNVCKRRQTVYHAIDENMCVFDVFACVDFNGATLSIVVCFYFWGLRAKSAACDVMP